MQRAFGSVVGEANTAIAEEGREPFPALQHIVDWLGDPRAARQSCPLYPHPGLKFGGEKATFLPASFQTFVGDESVDLALDVKQDVDAFDRLERNP